MSIPYQVHRTKLKVLEEQILCYQKEQKFVLMMLCTYSSKSRINLLGFKDICCHGYYIETNNEGNEEYLYITSMVSGQKLVLEKLSIFSYGLYYTTMRTIETNVDVYQKCSNPNIFTLWHDCLGHLGSVIMCRIIESSHEHPLKNQKILLPSDYPCNACSQGKLIIKLFPSKIAVESPSFLERCKGIFVNLYTHHVDHSCILWY